MRMPILSVARDYLIWHYSRAYVDIVNIWWNYLWFINHLFAVPDVLRSWLAPFKRLQENKVSFLKSPQDFLGNMLVNIIMRIVGAIIRTAILAMALVGFSVVFFLGLLFFLIWTVLPILILHFLLTSIKVFFL